MSGERYNKYENEVKGKKGQPGAHSSRLRGPGKGPNKVKGLKKKMENED